MSAPICSHTLGVTLCVSRNLQPQVGSDVMRRYVSAAICNHTLGVTRVTLCANHNPKSLVAVLLCVRHNLLLHGGSAVMCQDQYTAARR